MFGHAEKLNFEWKNQTKILNKKPQKAAFECRLKFVPLIVENPCDPSASADLCKSLKKNCSEPS
jgi:hypothetical protein